MILYFFTRTLDTKVSYGFFSILSFRVTPYVVLSIKSSIKVVKSETSPTSGVKSSKKFEKVRLFWSIWKNVVSSHFLTTLIDDSKDKTTRGVTQNDKTEKDQ
jgi:hypothetical protein